LRIQCLFPPNPFPWYFENMKYRCLMIDHDDTTVDSTPSIHYPAHREQMKQLDRPEDILSLEDWFLINYEPGIGPFMSETLKLNSEEQKLCYRVWREYTTSLVPDFFPGILPLLRDFRGSGGIVVVVSHSEADVIKKHYELQQELPGFLPDRIIGWEGIAEKHKPHPWPVYSVMEEFGLFREDILVVDDLKPGILMARRAEVDAAAVNWSHRHPVIREGLAELATYSLDSVEDLRHLL